MQDSLITVVLIVAALAAIVAVYLLVTSRRVFGEVGAGGLDARDGTPGGDGSAPGEREREIRQMLAARNARRERRGEDPQNLDAELAALLRPVADEDLRDDVRVVVDAHNRRLTRGGLQPLDIEQEIERRMRDVN